MADPSARKFIPDPRSCKCNIATGNFTCASPPTPPPAATYDCKMAPSGDFKCEVAQGASGDFNSSAACAASCRQDRGIFTWHWSRPSDGGSCSMNGTGAPTNGTVAQAKWGATTVAAQCINSALVAEVLSCTSTPDGHLAVLFEYGGGPGSVKGPVEVSGCSHVDFTIGGKRTESAACCFT